MHCSVNEFEYNVRFAVPFAQTLFFNLTGENSYLVKEG
jgi:hypothetical protein